MGVSPTFRRWRVTAPFVCQVRARIGTRDIVQRVGTSAVVVVVSVIACHVRRVVWNTDIVDVDLVAVKQDDVRHVSERTRVVVGRRTLPGDFGHEVPGAIDAVHQHLEVMAGGGIAVEVNGPGVLQDSAHLQQPNRHHAQVGLHPLAMGEGGRLEDLVHGRLFIRDQPHLSHVQVGQRPGVLESGAGRGAAHGAA